MLDLDKSDFPIPVKCAGMIKGRRYVEIVCSVCGEVKISEAGKVKKSKNLVHQKCINVKHNLTNSRIYRIWGAMKTRCSNTNRKCYPNYGGRGIKVCKEWADNFKAFNLWALANGYADNLSIDRVNNAGNYEPTNCRWATVSEQNSNRRDKINNKEAPNVDT